MTSSQSDLLALLAGVGCILVVATLIGQWLARKQPGNDTNPVIDNLNARIAAWWAMVVLLGLAFMFGKAGVIVLFGICSFAALREFVTLTNTDRADHWALAASFYLMLPIQYLLIWYEWYGLYSIFIPVYAFLLLPIAAAMRGKTERFLVRVAETQWALMITVLGKAVWENEDCAEPVSVKDA